MIELNEIFCSNMVLQANKPIKIFGEGEGNVSIEFVGIKKSLNSNSKKWFIEFPAMSYGGPYDMKVELDNEVILIENIFIGDVYLISGQSNLKLKLNRTNEPPADYVTNENVVSYTVTPPEPEVFSAKDGWIKLYKEQAENWSALGYYIGTMLSEKVDHKIGLVFCYHGAAAIQSFLPLNIAEKQTNYVEPEKRFDDYKYFWNKDAFIYDLMVEKISSFQVKAVVWYQGESNTSQAESDIYENLLSDLILSYRKEFCDECLPFVVVQLADFDGRNNDYWHKIQEIQNEIQYKFKKIKTVISKDICEKDDIHPQSKRALGRRISDALEDLTM